MAEQPPGDGRSIENPDESVEVQDEEPVEGKASPGIDRAEPRSGEHGLTTEEGVNEPGTKP